jgi:hypothetical protein
MIVISYELSIYEKVCTSQVLIQVNTGNFSNDIYKNSTSMEEKHKEAEKTLKILKEFLLKN